MPPTRTHWRVPTYTNSLEEKPQAAAAPTVPTESIDEIFAKRKPPESGKDLLGEIHSRAILMAMPNGSKRDMKWWPRRFSMASISWYGIYVVLNCWLTMDTNYTQRLLIYPVGKHQGGRMCGDRRERGRKCPKTKAKTTETTERISWRSAGQARKVKRRMSCFQNQFWALQGVFWIHLNPGLSFICRS